MDTPRRIRTPLLALGVVAVITQALFTSTGPPRIEVSHGTPAQRAMVTWALARFERVGLLLPQTQIVFHEDIRDCQGHVGLYWGDLRRLDFCVYHVDSLAKRTILHELAHAWDRFALREPIREDFLSLRHLRTWASPGTAWELQGQEQAAEVIAWGLMDQPLYLTIPDNGRDELRAAFELLTGGPSPFRSADEPDLEDVFSPEVSRSP